jgi:outer membrane protein TolC
MPHCKWKSILSAILVWLLVVPALAQQETSVDSPEADPLTPKLDLQISAPERPAGVKEMRLGEVIDLGLAQNPQMQVAAERVERARAIYQQQKSAKVPRLILNNLTAVQPERRINTDDLFTGISRPTNFPSRFVLVSPITDTFKLSLEVLLTTFGRVENTIAAAFLEIDTEMAAADVDRLNLNYQIKVAFFEKLQADAKVVVARENLKVTNKNLGDTQALFEQGVMSRYDILQAEIEVTRAVEQLSNDLTLVDQAFAKLGNVLAERKFQVQPITPKPIEVQSDIDLPSLTQFALEHRPEMQTLNCSRAVAQKLIDAAYGENQPTLTLAANYQTAFGQSLSPVDVPSLTLQLQWQIFDGGYRKAKVKEAEAVLRSIDSSKEQLENDILLQVEAYWLDLKQTAFNLKTAQQQLSNSLEYYDMARRRYINGLATTLEVSDSLRNLIAARGAVVEATYDRDLAFARLEQSLGHDVPNRHLTLEFLTPSDGAEEATP